MSKISKMHHNSAILIITFWLFLYLQCQILSPTKGTRTVCQYVLFCCKTLTKNWIASLDNCEKFVSQKWVILGPKWHKNVQKIMRHYETDLPQRERCWNCFNSMIHHLKWFFQQLPLWTMGVILAAWLEIRICWFADTFHPTHTNFGMWCIVKLILEMRTRALLCHFIAFI